MTDFRLLRRGGFYHAVAKVRARPVDSLHLRRSPRHRSGRCGARSSTASGAWTATPTRRTGISASATGCSTRTRTRWWNPRPRSWWPMTPGPGNWSAAPWPAPRPPCSAPPTGVCSETVELRPSRDLVSDPAGHPTVGRPEHDGSVAERKSRHGGHRRQIGSQASS